MNGRYETENQTRIDIKWKIKQECQDDWKQATAWWFVSYQICVLINCTRSDCCYDFPVDQRPDGMSFS